MYTNGNTQSVRRVICLRFLFDVQYKLDAAELGIGPLLTAWVDDALGEEKGDSGGRLGAVKGVDEVLDVIVTAAVPDGATVNDIFQCQESKSFKDARCRCDEW